MAGWERRDGYIRVWGTSRTREVLELISDDPAYRYHRLWGEVGWCDVLSSDENLDLLEELLDEEKA